MPSILHHIALVVAEPERSARIFESLFAARVIRPGSDHRGPPELRVQMEGLTLVLVQGEPPAARTDSHVAFHVRAAELVTHKARLAGLGIDAVEPRRGPPGRALYFVDYDNHLFELNCGPPLTDESES